MSLHDLTRDFVGRCVAEQAAYPALCDLVERVGARPSASPAERQAVELVLERLRASGFETLVEEFSFPGWQPGPTTVTMYEPGRPPRPLSSQALGWCPGGKVRGAVADVGFGSEEDFAGVDVRGRIALASSGSAPPARPLHRSRKYALAVEGGAAGFAFYDARPGGVVPMGSARLDAGLGSIPGVGIGYEDAMRLRRKGPSVEVEIVSACRGRDAVSCNGVAFKRGRSEEEIVVCGHIDSWFCEGAFDNGSGIVALLELARLLEPCALDRSLRFIAFGSEEPGLLGSKAYVQSHADLSRMRCLLNIDSPAIREGTLTITTNENSRLHAFFEQLARDLHLDLELHPERIHYSDHEPFRERGVACAQFLAGGSKYAFAHSVYDTLDKLSPECFTVPLVVAGAAIVECAMKRPDFSEQA
jgi:hypothetical protein